MTLQWHREAPGHYTAAGAAHTYVIDRTRSGWSLYARPAAGDRVHAHAIPTLALTKAAAAHVESGGRITDAVDRAFTDAADVQRLQLERQVLSAPLRLRGEDGSRMDSRLRGDWVTARDVLALQPRAVALANHYGVAVPHLVPDDTCGHKRRGRLGTYRQDDDHAQIRLFHHYLDTASILDVFAHEFAHHLDHERGHWAGVSNDDAHGPRFLAVWQDVREVMLAQVS